MASAAQPRYAFDVRDGNGNHLFYFLTQVTNGVLYFTYLIAGTGQYYWVPQGTEDSVYGSGVILQVAMSWDNGMANLYLNGTLAKSTTYTTRSANWSAASVFDLGAYEYLISGRYNVSDDIGDEFTVTGPATGVDTTPPVVSLTAPAGRSTVSATITVSANATDNVAVSSVQFQLDGVNLGAAVTGAGPSYSTTWNTTTATNGVHTLAAIATDTSGNTATSSISVTVNNVLAAPVISSVNTSSVTSSGATITWTTDPAASSQVAYGATSAYGLISVLDGTLVTSHSVTLSGLAAAITYHYQVLSRDGQGNLASSADFTLKTKHQFSTFKRMRLR